MLEKSLSVKLCCLTALIAFTSSTVARADEGSLPINYSESSALRGYGGVREANKIEFKYKERLKNWGEQIQMGISRGWLSDADAGVFKNRLEKLKALEAAVSSKGYPKPELDDMEKQFTKYNQDLSDAGTKSTAPPVPPGVDRSPADVVPSGSGAAPGADATDASSGTTAASTDKSVSTAGSAPAAAKSTATSLKTTSKKSSSKKPATKKSPARKK